jgi:hypothetical protein
MISKSTLQALQLLIRFGNFVHCCSFEWCEERRGLRSLEYNRIKWWLCQGTLVTHIFLRFLIIISSLAACTADDLDLIEVILALFLVSVCVLTLAVLLESLFRYDEVVEVVNTTLDVHYRMGK